MKLTIGYSSWAGDLKDFGAIYPFQGLEVAMVIAGLVFWVLWHIWQIGHENRELRHKSLNIDAQKSKNSIDRY
jgi:hypothetical protein